MQKILSLVWFKIFPAHFGGQKGIAGFYKSLSEYYPIDCICSDDNTRGQEKNLRILPFLPRGKWQFINPSVWSKIQQLYKTGEYTHVIIEFPYYSFIGAWLKKKGALFILHTHNIEGGRFKNLHKAAWRLMEMYERWGMKKADLVLFKTGNDKQYAINNYGIQEEQCYILPSGISDQPSRSKQESRRQLEETHNIHSNEKILLFAGTLDYLPNAEAVELIYNRLVPLLTRELTSPFRVIICGRNYFKEFSYLQGLKDERILQLGFVDDIGLYFSGADAFINPVQKLDGIQTKIFDALSHHLNVVAYEEVGESLPAYLLNKKVFLAKNDIEFVEQVERALNKEEETPALFFEEFHWDNIVRKFVKRLEELSGKN
jgi:polysaccharide biosynthesis protein PslH